MRQLQIAHGGINPGIDKMPRLQQVLRGVKAKCGKQGTPSCSCLPITLGILRKIKMSWTGKDSSFESVMLWETVLTMFFSFCRPGEIMVENEQRHDPSRHLSWWDALSPSIVYLNIKIPKTDQERVGCQVVIGKTIDDLCPVTALLDYLARRGNHPGALFQWQDKTPFIKAQIWGNCKESFNSSQLAS